MSYIQSRILGRELMLVAHNTSIKIAIFMILAAAVGAWPAEANQPANYGLPRYDFTVNLMPDSHRLDASGVVSLAPSDVRRQAVQLVLGESMGDLKVEIVEPRVSRGVPLLQRKDRPDTTPGQRSTVWTIVPKSAFPAGQPIVVHFSYAGGERPGFVFYLGPDGSFAGGVNTAWYPQVLDSVDGALRATGRLLFRVPEGYTAVASGVPELGQRPGEFSFFADQPTYFSFAVGKYTVIRKEGTVSTAVYLLRPRANAEEYLDGCARILDVLVREYGPHPYGSHFAIVEAPMEKAGGSGGASLANFMLTGSSSLDAPFNPRFYGHEIGHIWWGNLLRQQGNRGLVMLDEGMAQYSALLAVEALEGPKAAENFRRHGDPASPVELSASTYFALVAGGLDHPLASLPGDWNSRQLAYTKGLLVMDLLARTIGRDRFRTILHEFTSRNAFTRITWDQFIDALDSGTAGKYRWFFSQWFDRAGAPDWRLTWNQSGGVVQGVVTQEPPYFAGLVDVEAKGDSGCKRVRQVEVLAQARSEFAWPVDFRASQVELDPDFRVLHWTSLYRAEAPLLAPYWQAFVRSNSDKTNDSALAILDAALKRTPVEETMGARFMLEELTGRLLFDDPKRLEDAKAHLQRGLMSASRRNDRLGWTYFLLGNIASRLNDQTLLQFAVEGAVGSDALIGSGSSWGPATRALLPVPTPKQQ